MIRRKKLSQINVPWKIVRLGGTYLNIHKPRGWRDGMKGEFYLEIPAQAKYVVVGDPEKCRGCGCCEMICSLVHEGKCSRTLSRIHPVIDQMKLKFSAPVVCKQCDFPACYYACPVNALYIDEKTGARCIDPEKCIGCKKCMQACPFDIPRISYDPERKICIKCDLCGGDPQCVEYCPSNALTLVSTEGRPEYVRGV